MRVEQCRWNRGQGWSLPDLRDPFEASLVLVFGGREALLASGNLDAVRRRYPGACLFGCSTAGEILDTTVSDDSLAVTAVHFEQTDVRGATATVARSDDSRPAGEDLGRQLLRPDLVHVLVLSDGIHVNGSELVQGLLAVLPTSVTVTGGLSGDGTAFRETRVLWNDDLAAGSVVAVGLYGAHLRVGYASLGGWDPFGPERLITRSKGNTLYELDGRSALELYKAYLGPHAAELPASGLLYPLSVRAGSGETGLVRTILGIDHVAGSLTFAGDMPEGSYARLMKANFDRLVDGAVGAARACTIAVRSAPSDLAILISCVGRKLILKQRVEEEVEGVREVLGPRPALTGFYSYGEISPLVPGARCELHNQTMTITTLAEF